MKQIRKILNYVVLKYRDLIARYVQEAVKFDMMLISLETQLSVFFLFQKYS